MGAAAEYGRRGNPVLPAVRKQEPEISRLLLQLRHETAVTEPHPIQGSPIPEGLFHTRPEFYTCSKTASKSILHIAA